MTRARFNALLAYGFRPFFLVAGWFSVLIMGAWLWILWAPALPLPGLSPALWHGHEMLFGFVGAAIAGFMLTAVPSWTGRSGFAGMPLALLAGGWALGRIGFTCAGSLPAGMVALAELIFIPALALMLAPALLRARNRNTPLLLVLAILWACDAAFVYAWTRSDAGLAGRSLLTALNIVLLLITLIGGRIVPAFTGNALRRAGIDAPMQRRALIERLTIASMIAIVIVDAAWGGSRTAAGIALFAGVLQGVRLSGWRGWQALREPIVWVLHIAYFWLPLGLVMKGLHLLWPAAWTTYWLHALGAGAAAMMILAVMSRASLGHTGRPLVAGKPAVLAYLLLFIAVAIRVFGPAFMPGSYMPTITLAGVLWMAAFFLFSLSYTPILLSPRVDGKPG